MEIFSKASTFKTRASDTSGCDSRFLLPIIIFEAGWSMNHRAFVDLLQLGRKPGKKAPG